MFQQHAISIKESVAQATEKLPVDQLAEQMFNIFFKQYPEAESYFADYDMHELAPRKFRLLVDSLLDTLIYPDFAEDRLDEEVFRHLTHNLRDRVYYFGLLDALQCCIKTTLAKQWNDQYQEHWQEAVAGMMHMVDQGVKNHIPASV